MLYDQRHAVYETGSIRESLVAQHLNTEANAAVSDDFYAALLGMHVGLNDDESELLNARLILLLANQVGDAKVLAACIQAARDLPP